MQVRGVLGTIIIRKMKHFIYKVDDDMEKAKMKVLKPGDKFYVYPGLRHQMQARTDTELFEFSTQHFDEDSYRVEAGD